jgi:hypothetical protein
MVTKPGQAELEKMSEEELSEVTGQELLDFTIEQGQTNITGTFTPNCEWHCSNNDYEINIDNTDIHFTRLGLDTRIQITGDDGSGQDGLRIDNLKLGHYQNTNSGIGSGEGGFVTGDLDGSAGESFYHGPNFFGYNGVTVRNSDRNDAGSNYNGSDRFDISGEGLVFDVAGANAGSRQVVAKGPYVELAYENFDSNYPDLVGMRLGFEKIKGGAQIDALNHVSGTILAEDFGDADIGNCAGHRMYECPGDLANVLNLFGELALGSNNGFAGDGDGWTEDFWLSWQAQDMFWRHNNPAAETSNLDEARFNTDGAGFWLHLTDDVEGGL